MSWALKGEGEPGGGDAQRGVPVRRLSGGNVQKVLVGREIASSPTVLMSAYAVRGLDINTSYTIYNLMTEQKKKGVAVLFVGEDLDVLLELCDRILVLCGGRVSGVVDARTATKEEVGLLMTRVGGGKEAGGSVDARTEHAPDPSGQTGRHAPVAGLVHPRRPFVAAILLGALIFLIMGHSPVSAYGTILSGSLGKRRPSGRR